MDQPIYLITGATDGIGKQTALELAKRGAKVLVHGRTQSKAQAAKAELEELTRSHSIEAVHADLASLQEVRALAASLSGLPRLDALLNNAGVFQKQRALTPDGFEVTMGVNHFSHFLLTHLLLPLLQKSAQGRIINVSSMAHSRGTLDLNDLSFSRGFDGYEAYAASKLANVLFTYALARRLVKTKITVNALHPGVITTKLLKAGFGFSGGGLAQGAATSVYLTVDPGVSTVTGRYFSDRREAPSSPLSHEKDLQERLYQISAKLTSVEGL